jgi:predicted MFS family arabinose efflux permease
VLIPYFAKHVYGGDARTFGFLMAANGAGALAGVLTLAIRGNVSGLEHSIGRAALVAAAGMSVFSLAGEFWLGMAALAATGYCMFFLLSSCNTVIQSTVQDEFRGRVMSLYTMAVAGIQPLGNLGAGWLTEHIDVHLTLLGGAIASFAAGLIFLRGSRAATR